MKSSAVAQQTDSSPALGEANGRQELKIDAVAASPVVAVTGQQHPPRRRRSASTGSTLGSGTTAGGKRPSTKSTTPSVASAGSVQAVRRSSSSAAQSNNSNRKKSAAGSSSSSSLATNGDTSAGGLLRNKLKQQERRSSKASVQSQQGNVGQQPIKKKTNQAGIPLEKPAALSKQLSFGEDGGTESDEEDDERKRRLTFIFGIVGATLFVLAVLMVGIGLKMSSNADSITSALLNCWAVYTVSADRVLFLNSNTQPETSSYGQIDHTWN
ncbi:hypothetical protein DAPPUDRAFT_109493 [Daphnia pulex]|uniref:Uncharacterized protein n=1 Tax=Daphnia pulex TaxID=6669 RepID=E9H396_DAPPU|nr:hypothetical protein DAPPUDRAFT_109493 [Daphnia pulex]|eukprot:EFX73722.1 hypothetical protein DAPPUDRAFT_109493 [Daphnia pulex]